MLVVFVIWESVSEFVKFHQHCFYLRHDLSCFEFFDDDMKEMVYYMRQKDKCLLFVNGFVPTLWFLLKQWIEKRL